MRDTLIVYDGLPIGSGGAHRLRSGNVSDVREGLERFLIECTDRSQPDRMHLTIYEGDSVPSEWSNRIRHAATVMYGAPKRRQAVSGKNTDLWENTWTIQPSGLRTAANWLAGRQPLPRVRCAAGPPVVLGVEATFKLRDPRSGDVLPFQGPEHYGGHELGFRMPLGLSRLYARLSDRSTSALILCLPFTEVSNELRAYVARLQSYLPFKLSTRHWTRWQLNAQRSRYYPRKITIE